MELRGKDIRTSNDVGNISEAMISARFLQLGYAVYIPYGGKQRYNLLIEDAEKQLWRIQCKTAQIQNEGTVLVFHTASHNMALKDKRMRHYRGQCDFFAVYCEELNKIYLLSVDQVGTVRAKLRLAPAKNNQEKMCVVTGKNRQMRHYQKDCDFFAVYNAEINKIYLIPVEEVGITGAHLRLTLPKNKNWYGYRMASDYEL